jgi:Chromo (CHRromatin Organisation MOdifier) domain
MGLTPEEVACFDDEAYIVAEIRAHKGTPKDRSNLFFKVHWEGYPDSEDTWEPYSELRHLAKLHLYLEKHRMKALIPPVHRK